MDHRAYLSGVEAPDKDAPVLRATDHISSIWVGHEGSKQAVGLILVTCTLQHFSNALRQAADDTCLIQMGIKTAER